jgi:threonine/homoserine/homoserine lactone efflux protein
VWTLATSAGLAALIVASEPVFDALKLAGAAYLVWLGLQALRTAIRGSAKARHEPAGDTRLAQGRAFRQGLVSNLGNPKMALFFTSLLPQFAPASGPAFAWLLALGLLFCAMTLAWLTGYAVAVARAGDVLRRPKARRAIDAVTGTLLVALGLRLAAEQR